MATFSCSDTFTITVTVAFECMLTFGNADPPTLAVGNNAWNLGFTYTMPNSVASASFIKYETGVPTGVTINRGAIITAHQDPEEPILTQGTHRGGYPGNITVPAGFVGDGTLFIGLRLSIDDGN